MRDQHLPVSIAEMKEKAREVVGEDNPKFKASDGWIQKFYKQNHFTLRAKTSLSQYLPKNLEETLASFISSMKQHLRQKNYPMAFIGNMDETPVYFDLVPSKVVDRVGMKSCIIRTTGAEKRHIIVTLTVTANGEKLPPFIIFKGKQQPKLQVCGWWFSP